MKKPKYTKKLHRHRVSLMMKREDICECCPPLKEFSVNLTKNGRLSAITDLWSSSMIEICTICRQFIGLGETYLSRTTERCPCHVLGKEEAVRRTLKALAFYTEE